MRRGITVAAVCASGALAACGGGTSKRDFAQKADAACTDAAKQANQVLAEVGPVSTQQSAINLMTKITPVQQRAYDRVKALTPPSGDSADFQKLLSYGRQRIALIAQARQAAQKGDPAAYARAQKQYKQISETQEVVAAKIGLKVCAEQLPGEQQAAVRQVVTRNLTVGDPAECTQTYTAAYVKLHFGSQAKCVAAQRGKSPVKSIDILDLRGVANVSATATVIPHGGPANGKKFDASFVYENGHWVQDSFDPAA